MTQKRKKVFDIDTTLSLLNSKTFKGLQEDYRKSDETRERIIKLSRDVQKESKQAIYAIHRKDLISSKEKIKTAKMAIAQIKKLIKNNPSLKYRGSYPAALEEYVEAVTLLAFKENRKIPTAKELNVETEIYLQGLSDLTGEIVRIAVNEAIVENFKDVIKIKEFMATLYEYMLGFDFRNSPARKKFDSIKYNLQKIEDLILNLKIRDKIN